MQPVDVVTMAPLIEKFIYVGLRNGVVAPGLVQAALVQTMGSRGVGDEHPEIFANKITDHIRCVFGILREVKTEDNTNASFKTGSFRRAMSAAEQLVVKALLSKMSLDGHEATESPRLTYISTFLPMYRRL